MPVIGPPPRLSESIAQLVRLAREHRVQLIAIGNGTASRETDRLCAELIRLHPELKLTKVVVSEAGASIYSASAFASQELPGLDQRVAFWSPICWERSSPPPRGQPSSIEAYLAIRFRELRFEPRLEPI